MRTFTEHSVANRDTRFSLSGVECGLSILSDEMKKNKKNALFDPLDPEAHIKTW